MSLEFIHYGHDKFYTHLFTPIRNRNFTKPVGGLWASPLYSNHSWRDWCVSEEFNVHSLNKHFTFTVDKDAKIYKIESVKHLNLLPSRYLMHIDLGVLDFELIAKKYDAIWLTEEGERNTRYTKPLDLYGWDVESLLVLNPNIIITDYGKIKS